MNWLDTALEVAQDYGAPALISLAVSERYLGAAAFSDHDGLERVLDNVTARLPRGVGLYISILDDMSMRQSSRTVVENLLHVVYYFAVAYERELLVNGVGTLGAICLGLGAAGFGGSYETKGQRISLSDYVQRRGGGAYPKLVSRKTLRAYFPEELERLRDVDLLQRLLPEDETESSHGLFAGLAAGRKAHAILEWAQNVNNVGAARWHYAEVMRRLTEDVTTRSLGPERSRFIVDWLRSAKAHNDVIDRALTGRPLADSGSHVPLWTEAFVKVADDHGLL